MALIMKAHEYESTNYHKERRILGCLNDCVYTLATILAYSQSNQNKIKDSFPEVGGVATQEEGHIGLWSSCFLSPLSIKVPFVAAVTFRFQRWGGNCYRVTSTTFHTYLDVCYCRAMSVSARENVVFLHEAEIVFSALYFMANVTSTAVGRTVLIAYEICKLSKCNPRLFNLHFNRESKLKMLKMFLSSW